MVKLVADSARESSVVEVHPSDVFRSFRTVLRIRWRTLAAITALVFAIALALISLMPQKFEGVAHIRIDPARSPTAKIGETVQSLGSEAIETEVAVMGSPELARDVVRQLKLQNDPEFSKGLKPEEGKPPLSEDERLNLVTGQVLGHLDVGRDQLTYVIGIKFWSRDPRKAAAIANAFATTYIDTRIKRGIGTASRQAEWFQQQLEKASGELTAAQQRAAQFRAANGIVESGTVGTVNDQQVAPLATQLATAEAAAAEARSNLQSARRQAARGGLDAVTAVRSSQVIADLRSQRAQVEREKGQVEARYGPRHPEVIKVRDQMAALDTQIRAEANRVIGSLEGDAMAAEAQARSLRGTLAQIKADQAADSRAAALALTYDQDVINKKNAYDRLSQDSQGSTQARANPISQAEIVDQARVPTAPAPPSRRLLAILALIVSIALALTVVIIQELMNSGIRSVEDIERRFNLPILASLPKVKTSSGSNPAAMLLSNHMSMYAESLRGAYTSLITENAAGGEALVTAITSALPEEGKTIASVSLARVAALAGSPTLLIECDIRRARMSEVTGVQPTVSLVDVLKGSAPIEDAIFADAVPGLDLLLVGSPLFTAEDLFGGGKLSALLEKLRHRYTLIILDLPPVLGLADARTIAMQADAVLMAIRWDKTPAQAAKRAIDLLRKDGAPVIGALFTIVDPKAEAIGGPYYSHRYSSYYTQPA